MSSKRTVTDKARIIPLPHVSDVLGSNYYAFEHLTLLSNDGKLVVRYKNTGSMVLANVFDPETKIIKSVSDILHTHVTYPYIVTIHADDTFHLLNVETGQTDTFQQEKDTLKKVQCLLVDENRVFCITASTVSVWDRSGLTQPPRVIPLKDTKDKDTRTIINIKDTFSYVMSSNRLLLGNSDVFQIWELNSQLNGMHMIFEGRNSTSTTKYFGVQYASGGSTVATYTRDSLMIWDTDKPKKAGVNPKEIIEETLITCLHMDDAFITVGTCTGGVILRQRSDGAKIARLNVADAHPPTKKTETSLMDFDLTKRINVITKLGRWVFVGTEDSKFSVYDITKSSADPALEHAQSKSAGIHDLLIARDSALFTMRKAATKKKDDAPEDRGKPDVAMWIYNTQKIPGIEFFYDHIHGFKKERQFALLLSYFNQLIGEYLQGIERAGEDVIEFMSTVERVDDIISQLQKSDFGIPFQVVREVHTSLEIYADMLAKATQAGRLVRFFQSNRLRNKIEVPNSGVHSKLKLIEPFIRSALEEARKDLPAAVEPQGEYGMSSPPIKPILSVNQPTKKPTEYTPMDFSTKGPAPLPPIGRSNTANFLQRESMIHDRGGRIWWEHFFGKALMVEWSLFSGGMTQHFQDQFSGGDAQNIQSILDNGNTGYVSQYKFAEYLKGFGPFEQCVLNTKNLLSQRWFHGFLSSRESELLLKTGGEPDGSFLVRFSKSKPGSFALAFISGTSVKHILIESCMPEGFRISEQETSGITRLFHNLEEIISHYHFVLKYPYVDTISGAP
eukprot:TRINITY_DN8255_c0_g1_i3.p1 TRINITY_DN8255_c0_g1~~TRINITY_DN8255_c0_g1_i3.p1  ORF type:complete len:787 (+),score=186.79 TRINITY_DN8255_c0_g1_i3:20-2380(+)